MGVWQYSYKGKTYQRHFLPDRWAHLYIDGKQTSAWTGFRWEVRGNQLVIIKPNGDTESHSLLKPSGRLLLPANLGEATRLKPSTPESSTKQS